MIITGLLDMKRFPYDHLHAKPGAVIAWAEMNISFKELTQEINILKYFKNPAEKTKEILGIVKYCLILGIDSYHNATADWPGWLTDDS